MANSYSNPYAYMPQKSSGAYYGQGGSSYTNPYNRGGYGGSAPQSSIDPYTQMRRDVRAGQAVSGQSAQGGWGGGGGGWSPGGVGTSSPQRQYGMAYKSGYGPRTAQQGAMGQNVDGGTTASAPASPPPTAPGSQGYQWSPDKWDTNAQSRLDYLNNKTYNVNTAERVERENLLKNKQGFDTSAKQGQFQQGISSILPMLPQLQQAIMSIPSGPFDPSPEERWQSMLRQMMTTGNLQAGLQHGNAWGGV